jgi:hypothetical protein
LRLFFKLFNDFSDGGSFALPHLAILLGPDALYAYRSM